MDISDLHKKFRAKEIEVKELGAGVAERLEKTPYKDDHEISMAIDELKVVEDIDDYDTILAMIYDFGDGGHRLWVETHGR